ncbi:MULTISPECIES: Rieske 2Fe-2S domain-containing protein [Pseudofrankia]|uniref:Rieske 2Fe-2S domain-containing protein n=1 Tax=Pseudofrankia TaxID=2994363 RepID=UPI000234D69D|nr:MULTISPECIES: Rieske 2Fe-2S domain-containing protein [Pseudofrankia]OHV41274.1 hypothetical protein BCD49_07060 [Pseudofrankia sp. EUN1h]
MQRFAGSIIPLPRNHWYFIARTDELTTTPVERQLVERSMLLIRRADGTPVVLSNRCPHRSFTPAKGEVEDDYSWAVSRHSVTSDGAISDEVRRPQRYGFRQDVEGMRWIEQLCDGDGVQKTGVAADRSGLTLRRHLALMAEQEDRLASMPELAA